MSCVRWIQCVAVGTALTIAARAESPLDKLDPSQVSAEDRRGGPEKDVVAVLRARIRRGTAASFSPAGKTLATNGEGRIQLWRFEGRPSRREMVETEPVEVSSVAYSPDGKTLALGWAHRSVRLYNPASGRLEAERKFDRAEGPIGLAYSPDGKLLAVATGDQGVYVLDKELRTKFVLEPPLQVSAVAFSTDGRMVATCGDGPDVRLWEVSTGKERAVLKGKQEPLTALAFSPDGKTLAAGEDKGVTLWDIGSGQETARLKAENDRVTHLSFSIDGKLLSTDLGGRAIVWDGNKKVVEWKLTLPVCRATWAPDGKHLAIGDYERVYILRLPR